MDFNARELLAPIAGAAQSTPFAIADGVKKTVMVSPDIILAETAAIQISHDEGETWVDYLDGTPVVLTVSKNALRLYGPAYYRVDKSITATATGIYVLD